MERIIPHIEYRGSAGGYYVVYEGEELFFSKERQDADMFKAQLIVKIKEYSLNEHLLSENKRMKDIIALLNGENIAGFLEQVEQLKTENKRLREERDSFQRIGIQSMEEANRLREAIDQAYVLLDKYEAMLNEK